MNIKLVGVVSEALERK